MTIQPFQIDIPQATLTDLNERLARTRWPDEIEGAGWEYGTNLAYLQELVAYWQKGFDWREQEKMLNAFAHFRTEVDGFGLHFIHERGQGPNPLPLLLTHGWPDSFYRFHKVIPLLTDPERFGGNAEDAFDVIVPSLPGYGFSDIPKTRDFDGKKAVNLFAKLMTEILGYARFGAHGGDVGSSVTEALATSHADSLVGIHLTDIPYGHAFTLAPEELSETEKKYLEAGQQWQMTEGAYAMLQGTKPQTLAYALNDSPVGLASWIVEKFRAWSDCAGKVENRFSKDELLANIMIYWATQTIGSSFLPYYAGLHGGQQKAWQRPTVPVGIAIFPKDIVPAPRALGERVFNIERWSELPRGGHFAALEEPELLVGELREFFRPLRATI